MQMGIVLMVLSVFLASTSQIILKKSAKKKYESRVREYFNLFVLVGYGILFSTTVITVFALKYLPISLASSLDALGQVFVPILSFLILKERMTKWKAVGIIIIVVGIIVVFL